MKGIDIKKHYEELVDFIERNELEDKDAHTKWFEDILVFIIKLGDDKEIYYNYSTKIGEKPEIEYFYGYDDEEDVSLSRIVTEEEALKIRKENEL